MTIRPALVAAALILALAGCAGTPTRYYTLAEVPPATAPTRPAIASYAIEMAPIAMPERLARPQMVVRKANAPEAQVEILEQSRWSSSFESELRDALGAGIAARLSAVDASRTGNGQGLPVYRIAVQLRRFDALEGSRVEGSFGWSVRRTDASDVLGACQLVLTEAAAGGIDGLAQGAQRVTSRLADAIATQVAALAQQQRPACPG